MDNVNTSLKHTANLTPERLTVPNHDMLGYLLYLEHEKEHEKQRQTSTQATS